MPRPPEDSRDLRLRGKLALARPPFFCVTATQTAKTSYAAVNKKRKYENYRLFCVLPRLPVNAAAVAVAFYDAEGRKRKTKSIFPLDMCADQISI